MIKKINFQPLTHRVIVALPTVASKTESGIIKSPEYIASEQAKNDDYLTVVAVAPDVTKVKIGYRVLLSRMNEIVIDGEKWGLTDDEGIIGYQIK